MLWRSGFLRCALLLLLSGGCLQDSASAGSDEGPLADSNWVGSAAGWTLTLDLSQDVNTAGTRMAMGTLQSDRPECFLSGQVVLTISDTAVEIQSSAHGNIADRTLLRFVGTIQGKKMHGRLTTDAYRENEENDGAIEALCDVTNEDFIFTRQ